MVSVDKSISGFRAAGIRPLNSDTFTESDFVASDQLLNYSRLSDVSYSSALIDNTPTAEFALGENEILPTTSMSGLLPTLQESNPTSVSTLPFDSANLSNTDIQTVSELPTGHSATVTTSVPTTSELSELYTIANDIQAVSRVSVLYISPISKVSYSQLTRKSRCKRSEIITATPMKSVLEEKQNKQNQQTSEKKQ